MMDTDRKLRFANQHRIRELKRAHGSEIAMFCSHDEKELEALQGRSAPQGDGRSSLGERSPQPSDLRTSGYGSEAGRRHPA